MKKKKRKAGGDRKPPRTRAYPVEFRLRIVKLFLEEGYSVALISEEFGISHHSIRRWVRAYRRGGVEGLTPKPRSGGKPCVKPEIQERVIAVKKAHPEYGARRITDVLKRFFLIPTSQATVHKTLSEKGMVNKAKRKPVRNPPKPRFFERARPTKCGRAIS
jgi:putative transposase